MRPRIYFDESVGRGLGEGEVQRLETIVKRLGGTVVREEGGKEELSSGDTGGGKVTHIVVYDPEEHDSKEVIDEEERREKTGEEMDKTYLRTLGVVDFPVEGSGSAAEGGGGKVLTQKMAFIHWWYFPSSYDEWVNAADVSGEIEAEVPPNGEFIVCVFLCDLPCLVARVE